MSGLSFGSCRTVIAPGREAHIGSVVVWPGGLSTGESPMGYLRRVRIERSKSILQTRDTTIAEVAARLGFSDQSHFTRIFGRLVGTPRSFARCDDWGPHAAAGEGA